jgi:hypothetical protein
MADERDLPERDTMPPPPISDAERATWPAPISPEAADAMAAKMRAVGERLHWLDRMPDRFITTHYPERRRKALDARLAEIGHDLAQAAERQRTARTPTPETDAEIARMKAEMDRLCTERTRLEES